MQKVKVKDQGFTLVELLVSIAILVIVAIPLMNGFMAANVSTRKAKAIQKTTTLAQNIMETVKSQDMATLINNLDNQSYAKLNISNPYSIKPNSIVPTTKKDVDGIYEYTINNIQDGSHKYNVKIKFNADEYKTASGTPKVILTEAPKQNSYSMPIVDNLNSDKIVIIDAKGYGMEWQETSPENYEKVANTSLDNEVFTQFKTLHEIYINSFDPALPAIPDDILTSYISKSTIIEVDNTMISAKITYEIPGSCNVTDDTSGLYYEKAILSKTLTTTDGSNPLEKIYIFYGDDLFTNKLVLKNDSGYATKVIIVSDLLTTIQTDYSGTGTNWSIASNATINFLGANPGFSDSIVGKEVNPSNRIYSVKVEVSDSVSGKKYCELVSTKGE